MYVCLCLCLSLYGREVTVGYVRLRGSMRATFYHLAAIRSSIEFLFWDHWETAVLVQILAGRSQEVMGANVCHLAAPRPPIEFLFWDHWEKAVLGQILAWRRSRVRGGHGGPWEVTVGCGRLRRRKTEESGRTAGKRLEKNERKRRKIVKNRRKMEELRSSTESSIRWGSEQDSLQGDEK